MSTTGTTSFNPDLNELVEEAYERCGRELRSGYDLRTARRSLNLLVTEWPIKGSIYGRWSKVQFHFMQAK